MKKTLLKLTALVLAIVMCLSLAACGNDSGNTDLPGSTGGSADKKQDDGNHPEFAYTAEYKKLFTSDEGLYYSAKRFTEDGLYVCVSKKTADLTPEGVTPTYEGQYDANQDFLGYLSFDGKLNMMADYTPIELPAIPEGMGEFFASTSVSAVLPRSDGSFITIDQSYTSWVDAPEGVTSESEDYYNYYKYEQRYYVRTLDAKGVETDISEIEVPKDSYIDAFRAQLTADGNIIFPSDNNIVCIDTKGNTVFVINGDNYVDSMFTLSDGSVGVIAYGDSGEELRIVDVAAQKLGEPYSLPNGAYACIPGGGDYDLYYTSGVSFYGYKMETQTSEKLFSWLDCDVNSNNLNSTYVTDDGRVLGYITEWEPNGEKSTSTVSLVVVSKKPWDQVPHKQELTLATLSLDYYMRNAIIKFNRTNDAYRIVVKEYSEYNNDVDWSEHQDDNFNPALDKLNTEIVAGNMPDILCLNSLPYTQLASKGLLEDLYPFMDKDPDINRGDFFQNVLKALEVNGKLYTTVSTFSIDTVVGAASVVGDKPGWNFDQFNEALSSMPAGCTAFDQYITRADILTTCLSLDMAQYVDWTTGKCSFDNPDFVKLLHFAKSFPAKFDWESYDYSEDDSTEKRIKEGRQMLLQTGIYGMDSIMWDSVGSYFGGDVCYIGYPSASGIGSKMNIESGYAISASCKDKEAAWQFLRTFYSEDYLKDTWGLPISRVIFNKRLDKAMTVEYEKDANGNFILNSDGEKIAIQKGGAYNSETGEWTPVYAMSKEQAQQVMDLIDSTTKLSDYNAQINEIVSEQAEAFFSGEKTAEDVARLIQSAVNIYVNEQR